MFYVILGGNLMINAKHKWAYKQLLSREFLRGKNDIKHKQSLPICNEITARLYNVYGSRVKPQPIPIHNFTSIISL